MKQKHAFVIFSDETAESRIFHALTYAWQAALRGDDTQVYFAAEATAWPALLGDKNHKMNELFNKLQDKGVIQGACQNCAVAFGHEQTVVDHVALVKGPSVSDGQIDILGLEDNGYRVWLF